MKDIKHGMLYYIVPENAVEIALTEILIDRIEQGVMLTELATSMRMEDDFVSAGIVRLLYGAPSSFQRVECYNRAVNGTAAESITPRFTESERAELRAMNFNAEEIKHWFVKALELYRIPSDSWAIEVGDHCTSIEVRAINSTGHPAVVIPTDQVVDGLELLELIGHEIDCHLRTVENARHLFLELLGADSPLAPLALVMAKSSDELLDEGQAKLSDISINGNSALPTPYYSIAVSLVDRGYVFDGVAEALYDLYLASGKTYRGAARSSWADTYSVFRGATSPEENNGYAFTKDDSYYVYKVAKTIDPVYLDYASAGFEELHSLFCAIDDISSLKCKYPKLDIVAYIKDRLLSK